jgi:hypothetical protein
MPNVKLISVHKHCEAYESGGRDEFPEPNACSVAFLEMAPFPYQWIYFRISLVLVMEGKANAVSEKMGFVRRGNGN